MPVAKKSKMSTVKAPAGFIKVTRMYSKDKVYKKGGRVGKQTTLVNVAQVVEVRIRKKIEGANATLVTAAGRYINVAQTAGEISKLINAVYAE